MLIRGVELVASGRAEDPWQRADVQITGETVTRVGAGLDPRDGERVLEGAGGALLPALHDHHIHLLALAAALESVDCGPPAVRSPAALEAALRDAPGDWVRGVGYHESVAGDLDHSALDRLAPGRRVRIQHRSGAAWLLSSAALDALGITATSPDLPAGVERDPTGQPTGRLFRLDDWLRDRLPAREPPGLEAVGRTLAQAGVASVTDATPTNGAESLALLTRARAAGTFSQRVVLMGGVDLTVDPEGPFERGPVKLVLDERALPAPEDLERRVGAAHDHGRAVAVHCVTRAELVLALHAIEAAGPRVGDRIEHASVAPPELAGWLARLGLCVVTQPGFLFERGDQYLRDVDPADRPWLYRCQGLDRASVAVGGGTDAPYSSPDPWRAMRAAVERKTAAGHVLGGGERVSPERALALFTTPHDAPGHAPRRVEAGARADLVLLDRPWRLARDTLARDCVVATLGGGRVLWQREAGGLRSA